MQSSLELFPNDSDKLFIKECCRVLRTGGRAIILPIYIHRKYMNCFGISYYKKSITEETAKKRVRFDYNVPFTRLYDISAFDKRLIKSVDAEQVSVTICIIKCDERIEWQDKNDSFIYFRYALVIDKK